MAPEYQRELYIEVKDARFVGYAISVINMGAAFAANVRPKPMRNLLIFRGDLYFKILKKHTEHQ